MGPCGNLHARSKRMALPSIVLLVVFVAVGPLCRRLPHWTCRQQLVDPASRGSSNEWPLIAAGLFAARRERRSHWFRFHVPITIAAGCAALRSRSVACGRARLSGLLTTRSSVVLLPLGLIIFAVAMRFDMSDRARQTRRTDIAFWLHLLAAPLHRPSGRQRDRRQHRARSAIAGNRRRRRLLCPGHRCAHRRSPRAPRLLARLSGATRRSALMRHCRLGKFRPRRRDHGRGHRRARALGVCGSRCAPSSSAASPHCAAHPAIARRLPESLSEYKDTHDRLFSPRNRFRTRPPYRRPEGRQARRRHRAAQPLAAQAA